MKIKTNIKMGHAVYQFEIEGQDEMELLHKAIVLTNPRRWCKLCANGSQFYFTSNKDKEGNIYINVKCGRCNARSKLGKYKTGGYFWHDFKLWQTKESSEKKGVSKSRSPFLKEEELEGEEEKINQEDIPF